MIDDSKLAPPPPALPPASLLAPPPPTSPDRGDAPAVDLAAHVQVQALRGFMLGTLPAGEVQQVLRHLLAGCLQCQAQAREVWNLDPPAIAAVLELSGGLAVQSAGGEGEAPAEMSATTANIASIAITATTATTAMAALTAVGSLGAPGPLALPRSFAELGSVAAASVRRGGFSRLDRAVNGMAGTTGATGPTRGRAALVRQEEPIRRRPGLAAGGAASAPSTLSPQPAATSHNTSYDQVLDRVFSRVTPAEAAIEASRRRGRELFEELMQHPPTRQGLLVRNSARFSDRFLCEELLNASRDEVFRDGTGSAHLARLAVEISGRILAARQAAQRDRQDRPEPLPTPASALALPALPANTTADDVEGAHDAFALCPAGDLALLAGLAARAHAQFGNALRVLTDMDAAGKAFEAAEAQLVAYPSIGPLDKARVLDLQASFYLGLRQLETSARLLDRVIAIYGRLGQRGLLGRALNLKAIVLGHQGDLRGRLALLQRALNLIDPQTDARWFLAVRHNIIVTLLADGCPREAFALLFHTRPLYLKMGDRWSLLRLRWVEGQVAHGMNRLDQAEAAYREVSEAFVEGGHAYDAALASLDLAVILAQQGKTAEMRLLAHQMVSFFEARQLHREAMAAYLVFCDAARADQAGLNLVREVSSFLQQARNAPSMRFTPSKT
jgi:tetratricopeptide (TPR) repeat protein